MNCMWVITPSGKQIIELPYQTALRIARKRGFGFSTFKPRLTLWEKITKRPKFTYYPIVYGDGILGSVIDLMPTMLMMGMLAGVFSIFSKFSKKGLKSHNPFSEQNGDEFEE